MPCLGRPPSVFPVPFLPSSSPPHPPHGRSSDLLRFRRSILRGSPGLLLPLGLCIGLALSPASGSALGVEASAAPAHGPLAAWDAAGLQLSADSVNRIREQAVTLAREGAWDPALALLRPLRGAYPEDVLLRGDLAAVLAWSGRHEEAVREARGLPFEALDPVIAEAIARAARETGQPALAVELHAGVLVREGPRRESEIGLALALLEDGQIGAALERVPILRALPDPSPDLHMAEGHVLGAAGRWVEAAAAYRRAGMLDPREGDPRELEVVALREAGAEGLAHGRAMEAQAAGLPVPTELWHTLVAGRVALLVAWAPAAAEVPGQAAARARVTRALVEGEAGLRLIEEEGAEPLTFAERRLRLDRLVALRALEAMDLVLEEAEALEARGVELPPYALRVVGDAALAEHRYEEAVRRYRDTLAGWPDEPRAILGLFWSLVGLGAFDEADAILSEVLEEAPLRRTADGLPEPLPNLDRWEAELARHLGWALAGDLPRALEGLRDLHHAAPLHLEIRQELASVLHWRGWHGDALALYQRILALDPEHVPARAGLVSVHLARHERAEALRRLEELEALAPGTPASLRARRALHVDGRWALNTRVESGRSTGGEFGTRDRVLQSRLVSPPLGLHLRARVGLDRMDARYPEGVGAHERASVGFESRFRPLHIALDLHADRTDGWAPGVAGEMILRPGDRWRLGLSGDSRSPGVPLRATLEDITGWEAGLDLSRRSHEGRRVQANLSFLALSDGNERRSVYLAVEQQVARTPFHRLALLPELYGTRNTRESAPYFNPSELLSGTVALLWDWTLHRDRDRAYSQRATVTGGMVRQADQSDLGVLWLHLEHRWDRSDTFALLYGLNLGYPVYDGVRERRIGGHLGLIWRLP